MNQTARIPVLIMTGNQSGSPRVMYATLKSDGSGYGSDANVTVSGGVITVTAEAYSWASAVIIYPNIASLTIA